EMRADTESTNVARHSGSLLEKAAALILAQISSDFMIFPRGKNVDKSASCCSSWKNRRFSGGRKRAVYQLSFTIKELFYCKELFLYRKVLGSRRVCLCCQKGCPMKILCVSQNKGGVGKTSLVKLISVGLSKKGLRVLAIDLDAQCNLSKRFIEMERDPAAEDGSKPPLHPEYNPAEDDDWDGFSSSAAIYTGRLVVPYPTAVEN